jgi:accessory colonization factor AcfC
MDTNQESSRKGFLQMLSKAVGAQLANHPILSALASDEQVLKLNEEQQSFMIKYGQWMDENIEVLKQIRIEPDNMLHRKKMMDLSVQAEEMQGTLTEYMKSRDFGLIYPAYIKKLTA